MQHFNKDILKTKRYGQVFSGNQVGDLLVSLLPEGLSVKSIIDPMVGQGDLLRAANEKYPLAEKIRGIDIDEDIQEACSRNIPKADIVIADAFKSKETSISDGWDLVITNPPYVRYQTLKSNPSIGLPNASEIRESLIHHISKSRILDTEEKQMYLKISKQYSGLSDMAVPSWILCASIVKQGGYLAMVVPETWLNRDYALPIHYLLLRCFEIVAIARDVEAKWFKDAEVKTCLVICKRKKNSSINSQCKKTMFLEIGTKVAGPFSLVDNLVYEGLKGNNAITRIIETKAEFACNGFSSNKREPSELFPGLLSALSKQKWICDEDRTESANYSIIPNEIKDIVGNNENVEYVSLQDLGWSVGQGLRTGANDFFYAELMSEKPTPILQSSAWYGQKIQLSNCCYRKALKKRSDIDGLVVDYSKTKNCIIYIQHHARQADLLKLSPRVKSNFNLIDSDLEKYISVSEKYVCPSKKKSFKDFSAVITNEKKTTDGYERFWYMLPPLSKRHIPDLCISRVCSVSPETLFINHTFNEEIVVDANFITLWNPDYKSQMVGFALLNSSWAKLFLEITGTAMGGGALKLEASQIRRVVFPRISCENEVLLEQIGKSILLKRFLTPQVQNRIDEIVASAFGEKDTKQINSQIRTSLNKKLQERTGRNEQG